MTPLTIKTKRYFDFNMHIVSGFTDDELAQLRGTKNPKDKIVSILDERNNRIGTCWECGYGIYEVFVGEKDVCVTTGISCD